MAKILILANSDIGLYKCRKELVEELRKKNEIFVSLPYGEFVDPLIDLGCTLIDTKVDRRGLNPIKDLKLFFQYNGIIKKIKPDLVITYTIKPGIYGGMISRFYSIDYAINVTGLGTAFQKEGLLKKIIIYLYKYSCKRAKVVFFENGENQKFFINHKMVLEEKTYRLNGAGINLKEFYLCEFPEEEDGVRFLFIGRIMKEKGIDELLKVAEKMINQQWKVHFDIVGPQEENYIVQMMDFMQKGIINYYGYQKDIRPFIKKAHCVVLPSYHEGMANTLLESGAMGRALITTNIPGCREAVIDGENGYLTRAKDPDHLYETIIKFLNLTKEAKEEMGMKSRKHMEAHFNKSDIVAMTIEKLGL